MSMGLVDTTKQDKQQKKAERKRRRELADIREVLTTPSGRRFYWRVMTDCGVFQRSFTGEVNTTMFNEGRRSIGNWLFNELMDANPNMFAQLSNEAASEAESEKRIEEMEQAKTGPLG